MLETIVTTLWPVLDWVTLCATECWDQWSRDPKDVCLQGMAAIYLAGLCGARHHDVCLSGALCYLAMVVAG